MGKFLDFFNNDYQLMVGAAKIFSVLGESKDAGVINFQHGPCCITMLQ